MTTEVREAEAEVVDEAVRLTVTLDDVIDLLGEEKVRDLCAFEHCSDEHDGWLRSLQDVERIHEHWHNDNHEGTYRFCHEQPCRDIREAVAGP